MDLSIVVPTYNAKQLAHQTAESLQSYLAGHGIGFEIVLVDDGSLPAERPDNGRLPAGARLVQLGQNQGKGAAVRAGLASATGRSRVFTDVDLPYGLESLMTCYRAIVDSGMDFVYGDRSLPTSSLVARPSWRRRMSSAVFRLAVSGIVGLRPTDTQCGLKGFSGPVADALVKVLRTDHFAFDVEIFKYARDNNLRVYQIPVQLVNEDISTVRLARDAMTMVRDLVTIRQRAARGEYRLARPAPFAKVNRESQSGEPMEVELPAARGETEL